MVRTPRFAAEDFVEAAIGLVAEGGLSSEQVAGVLGSLAVCRWQRVADSPKQGTFNSHEYTAILPALRSLR